MKSFTIETTQTEKRAIEIRFPSFYRNAFNKCIAIIDEDNIYACYNSEKLTIINSGTSESMKSEINDTITAKEITEEEFMAVYNAARKATDLTPHISRYATSEGITNRITE